MRKLLVVDDEEKIRTLVKKYAQHEGYEVFEAENGLKAIDTVIDEDIDIIILDLMMPEMNGFDACRYIRQETQAPIIMLTARDGDFDKYQGFELGIDDYVVKPFSPKELMYRVEAILKRTHGTETGVYKYETLHVNDLAHSVIIDNVRVDLSPKEYDLLLFLIKNKGIAIERDLILNKVWGYDFFGDDRTLDTHIKRLRKKLGRYSTLITTLRGVGYRYEG